MRGVLASLVLAFLVAACGGGGDASKSGPKKLSFPVEVVTVEGQTIEYAISAVGTVEAFETVLVTARVRGVIEKVNFREGQEVKPEQVLVEIEPQTYRNALDSANARLLKAEAAVSDAEFGLNKREEANAKNPGIFSPEEVETWRNKVKSTRAEVSSARVDVSQAALDLENAFAKAPIGGIIQTRTAQTGAYVQPGTLLATLQRRDPLLVRFAVTEQEAGYLSVSKALTFTARDTTKSLNAKITYIAAAANVGSRMVEVLSEVDAKDRELVRPGTFAQVRIVTSSKANTPAIPQTAVRPSERGFLAYVIEKGQAKERVLTLGLRTDDGRVEVRAGLSPGEKLVVRGGEALRDGVSVTVTERKSEKPASNEEAEAPGEKRP
jgi:membrane fusion protein, multidrug efflux system